MWSHRWKLPDKAKLYFCILQIITFCLFLCGFLKGEYWSFYIPTNPLNPFSLGPFSSYLLQTSSFKQLVSPILSISYLCSLRLIFPLIRLPCTRAYSFLPRLLLFVSVSISPSLIISLLHSAFPIVGSNFANARVEKGFAKCRAPESLGVSPSCCWNSRMHLFP